MSDYDSYMKSVKKYERISKEREIQLSKIIQSQQLTEEEKDKAKKELVESNLFLVISRAYKIHQCYPTHQFMDLIAEGNISLIKAAERYDVSREGASAFVTFAVKIIDRDIHRFIQKDRTIRVPEKHFSLSYKIKKMEEDYQNREDNLTDEDVMKELNVGKEILSRLKDVSHHRTISLEEVNVRTEDGESSWAETIADMNCTKPYKEADLTSLRKYLDKYINRLTKKEKMTIEIMFLNGDRPSLVEAGTIMKVSPERVRQLIARSLRKLKLCIEKECSSKIKGLKSDPEPPFVDHISPYMHYLNYRNKNISPDEMNQREKEYQEYLNKESERVQKEIEEHKKIQERKSRKIINYFCGNSPF